MSELGGSLIWQQVLRSLDRRAQESALAGALRTRKRFLGIQLNGRVYLVRRALVRDYLKTLCATTKRAG